MNYQSYFQLGVGLYDDGWTKGAVSTIGMFWLALSIGQATSLMVHRRIISLLLAIGAGFPLISLAMIFDWWGISPFVFTYPMFTAICCGSCWLAGNWLVVKPSSTTKTVFVLIVVSIGASLCFYITEFRRTEIPLADSKPKKWELDLSDTFVANRNEYLKGLRSATKKYSPVLVENLENPDDRATAVNASMASLEELRRARSHVSTPGPVWLLPQDLESTSYQDWERDARVWFQLAQLGAMHEERDNRDFTAALDYYWMAFDAENLLPDADRFRTICNSLLAWSETEGQAPDILKGAISTIAGFPSLDYSNLNEFRVRYLKDHLAKGKMPPLNSTQPLYRTAGNWMDDLILPSENERSLRLAITFLGQYVDDLNLGYYLRDHEDKKGQTVFIGMYSTVPFTAKNKFADFTRNVRLSQTASWLYNVNPDHNTLFRREMMRRYLLVRLALTTWRLEQGQYPEDLEKLKDYFPRQLIPLDLRTGRHFKYFPNGLDADVNLDGDEFDGKRIPANTPMLFPYSSDYDVPWRKDEGHRLEGSILVPYEEYQVRAERLATPFFYKKDFDAIGPTLKKAKPGNPVEVNGR